MSDSESESESEDNPKKIEELCLQAQLLEVFVT